MRLNGKIALVVGGGQQSGETTGNGRATCLRFAEEGATVLVVDQNLAAAEETVAMIKGKGGSASSLAADITREADCKSIADTCVARHDRIDILHNNVGARGDKGSSSSRPRCGTADGNEPAGMFLTINAFPCASAKWAPRQYLVHLLDRERPDADIQDFEGCHQLDDTAHGLRERYGIRINTSASWTLHGHRAACQSATFREQVRAERGAQVPPLSPTLATPLTWPRAVFASDEARYITGVLLLVDGGLCSRSASWRLRQPVPV
jgi:NAD(P)-dependent dehydrogenase (short-subunit alcohol dehydrogenase family)